MVLCLTEKVYTKLRLILLELKYRRRDSRRATLASFLIAPVTARVGVYGGKQDPGGQIRVASSGDI